MEHPLRPPLPPPRARRHRDRLSLGALLRDGACFGALALGLLPAEALAATAPGAQSVAGPAWERPAVATRAASRSVLLGAAMAGTRVVAVGERGIIVLSDDQGRNWRQAAVPVSVTLTAVRFADPLHGVAVGHAGTIVASDDGGAHWRVLLDGRRIAAMALAGARATGDAAAIGEAERLVADGPDKPLLDLCQLGDGTLLAVGAYGLAVASADGGRTWAPWMARLDNPKGLHLNAVRRRGDTVLIGGEHGLALLSRDGARSFQRLAVPYDGSFFSAELPAGGELVLAGLRGNVWRSTDGANWRQLDSPMPVTITASATRADGTLVFANQAGMLLAGRGAALVTLPGAPLPPLNGVLALADGALLALGVQGVALVPAGAAPVAGGRP